MTRTKQVPVTPKKIGASTKVVRGALMMTKRVAPAARITAGPADAKKRQYRHTGLYGIRKQTLKKLMLKGGVLRVSGQSYKKMRDIMWSFLRILMKDSHTYSSYAGRKTINAMDMVDALSGLGHRFYGQAAL